MEWGICTTVKAPLPQILAFVAWHKHVGVSHIWIHLDDADPVTADVLSRIDDVTAILCDDTYWKNGRPKAHQGRQTYNMRRVYNMTALPVLAHIDVDEYLFPQRDISSILDDWKDAHPFLRVRPAEALNDPTLEDDIFTACHFRLPFPTNVKSGQRIKVLGDYDFVMPYNILSHRAGKAFFKTGVKNLYPRIHSATVGEDGPPIHAPFNPEIMLLHFHAQNKDDWLSALHRRATKGAYRTNDALVAFTLEASKEEIDHFYTYTHVANPRLLGALKDADLLVEADLRLKEKVAGLF